MLKKILYIILLLVFAHEADAQRHVRGQFGFEFQGGIQDRLKFNKSDNQGYYGGFAFSRYNRRGSYLKFGALWQGKFLDHALENSADHVLFHNIQVPFTYGQNVFSSKRKDVYLNILMGLDFGYEFIEEKNRNLSDGLYVLNDNTFSMGPHLGIESEIYASDKVVFLLHLQERYNITSDVQKFKTQFGLGLKFILNKL